MTNETEETQTELGARRKVSEKLVELLKQNAVVPVQDVDASRLNALAVYTEVIVEDYNYVLIKYAVLNNVSITKTQKGNYALEGEKINEIWIDESHNGWLCRIFSNLPEWSESFHIRQGPSTKYLGKLLERDGAVIPLYREDKK